jgi:hypothetical protein
MSAEEVFSFAQEMTDSVMCLRTGGHHLQAAMLTYVAIEQMAWLSVKKLKSTPLDFQEWVNRYMQPYAPLPCTAREMWEARNGLLHMGTAESAANRDSTEIRLVLYVYGNTQELANKSKGVVFVRVEDLVMSYFNGVTWFLSDLKASPEMMEIAKGKLVRMLSQRPVTPPL